MNAFGLLVTIIVLLAIALAIMLFERRRAREIEHDLTDRTREHPPSGDDPRRG